MAYVGLRKLIIGKMKSEGTYETPIQLGKAIGVNVNPNYAEGSLYADDEQAEYDKEFTYADVTLNTSTIPIEASEAMFGHMANEKDTGLTFNKDDQAEYVGVGWISQEKVDGKRKFIGNFLVKAKFTEPSEEYATKGENIEYKTPSISGRATTDENGDWKKIEKCDTAEKALEFVYKCFGTTVPASLNAQASDKKAVV